MRSQFDRHWWYVDLDALLINSCIREGVAVACAIKAAIQKFDIPATVILLGTPG